MGVMEAMEAMEAMGAMGTPNASKRRSSVISQYAWEDYVTIFTLHRTFPHSCLYLPPVTGQSLYTIISSYLPITTYCLLRRSNAVCLLMHSLLTYTQHAQPSCTVYKDIMDTHFQ